MTERTRAGGPPPPDVALSAEDIRRQLEGRAEVLEFARGPHAELEAVLSARGWKRRLRRRPKLVSAVVRQAEALEEALERVRRRAVTEGWPENAPIWKDARELAARRERLAALVRRRLDTLTGVSPVSSLEEDLTRLEALVRQPVSGGLKHGEVLVFESDPMELLKRREPGDRSWKPPLLALSFLGALLVCGALWPMGAGPDAHEARQWLSTFLLLGFLSALLWPVLRAGTVKLTSERLLWVPAFGEPVVVRLGSIPDGGIRVEPGRLDVHVAGDRKLCARGVPDAARLAVMLELHRQPPLRGAARAGVRLRDVVVYPATLGTTRGHAVLRPQGVSFVPDGHGPERSGPDALRAVTGKALAPSVRVDVAWVLDALLWLPDSELDDVLLRVVEATGGTHWSAWRTRSVSHEPVWKEIRLHHGADVLRGKVEWAQQAAAEQLLGSWPQAPGTDSPGTE